MKKIALSLMISLLILVSCQQTATPPSPNTTSTPRPQVVLSESATLFSGPGNLAYENLAMLPIGTTVRLDGSYGDFIRVTAIVAGAEIIGYIWKEVLQTLPGGLPVLDVLDVPWEPMYLPSCAPGDYNAGSDSVTFPAGEGDFFFANSAVWNLDAPVRVTIGKMTVTDNSQGIVGVAGVPGSQEDPTLWWKGHIGLSLGDQDGMYVLWIRDGQSEDPAATIELQRSSSQPVQILFDEPRGRSFSVLDEDNQELRHVDVRTHPGVNLPDGLFPERKFYFGIAITGQGEMVLTGLSIGTEPEGNWAKLGDPGSGLAALAEERNLSIGPVFDRSKMIDRRYCQALQHDFNVISIPDITWTIPGWDFWVGPGQYHFENVDRAVDLAQQRGWRVYGSHLVWGASEAIPDWLRNENYTRDDYIALLEEHIRTMMEHYRGKIQLWGIANEAPERDFYYPTSYVEGAPSTRQAFEDFWYEKIGPEYIKMAFRWAREADPDAILVFNSGIGPAPYAGDGEAVADQMFETVKALMKEGVPIDAIGTQMHLLGPRDLQQAPTEDQVKAYIQKWDRLGLRAYITELDVDLGSTTGTQEERYAYQAQIYRDIMEGCLGSGVCDGFMMWGVSDSISWIALDCPTCPNELDGDPYLFGWNFERKPAYFAVRDALEGDPVLDPVTPTPRPTSREAIDSCITQMGSAASSPGSGEATVKDDFSNPAYTGAFNSEKWRLSDGLLPDSIAQQREGVLVLGNTGDLVGAAAGLTLKAYDGITLDQPMYFEADLALCPNSSAGGVNIAIRTIDFEPGSWMASCGPSVFSAETKLGCSDFLWAGQMEDQYETPGQSIESGTWHRLRIEADPAALTIRYFLDGVAAGSHSLTSAEKFTATQFLATRFQFVLGMWKLSADSPLLGLVDNVRIGLIAP